MKKRIALAIALSLTVMLCACGEKNISADENKKLQSISSGEELRIPQELQDQLPAEEEQTEMPEEEKKLADVIETPVPEELPEEEVLPKETVADPSADGLRREFKEAMDSYEAFYDEYCSFLEEYKKNSTNMELITKYFTLLEQAGEMDEKFQDWEAERMSDAELKYYLEVSGRVLQKLSDAAAD